MKKTVCFSCKNGLFPLHLKEINISKKNKPRQFTPLIKYTNILALLTMPDVANNKLTAVILKFQIKTEAPLKKIPM